MIYPWQSTVGASNLATNADFIRAANIIGCEVAVIRAVWKVEAAGRPFRKDGSLERRFEPHHFPKSLWRKIGFSVKQGELAWRASLRLSTDAMARKAYEVNPSAMLTASSWGGPQIMGFNAADAGYKHVEQMVSDMAVSEGNQLDAFVRLITKWGLDSALRSRDWAAFAKRYNGSGQVARYSTLLSKAFAVESTVRHAADLESAVRKETGAPSKVVLRIGSEGSSVRELQRALGLDSVDGVFGVNTRKAVIDFQTRHGLKPDGVVGHMTWTKLSAMGIGVEAAGTQPVFTGIADIVAQIGVGSGAAAAVAAAGTAWALPILLGAGAAWLLWRRLSR